MANTYKQTQKDDKMHAALADAQAIGSKGTPIARLQAVRHYQNAMGVDQRTAERAVLPNRFE